jgi:hypothetical protein
MKRAKATIFLVALTFVVISPVAQFASSVAAQADTMSCCKDGFCPMHAMLARQTQCVCMSQDDRPFVSHFSGQSPVELTVGLKVPLPSLTPQPHAAVKTRAMVCCLPQRDRPS